MVQLPKGGSARGHDKPMYGSCAIYFLGGTYLSAAWLVLTADPQAGNRALQYSPAGGT